MKLILFLPIFFAVSPPASAQQILIPDVSIDTIFPVRAEKGPLAIYVNATASKSNSDNDSIYYPLGNTSKLVLSAVTLQLIKNGSIDLDTPLFELVPELIEEQPFAAPLTIVHLLTETGGFAMPDWYRGSTRSPAWISTQPLNNQSWAEHYLLQVRSPGQMAHDDPVGWAVLATAIENATNTPLSDLIQKHLTAPFGLSSDSLRISQDETPPFFAPVFNMEAESELLIKLARLLIRNPVDASADEPTRYLPNALYDQLARNYTWRMHPLVPGRTLGATNQIILNRNAITLWSPPCTQGASITAFPENGAAFVTVSTDNSCASHAPYDWVKKAVTEYLPESTIIETRMNELRGLANPSELGGIYIQDSAPSGWLQKRLSMIQQTSTRIRVSQDLQSLEFTQNGNRTDFQYIAPYTYRSDQGSILSLSPFKLGGYFYLDGETYRQMGPLGDARFVIAPLPWAILILLTGGIYLRSQRGVNWRRMGQFSIYGTMCVGAGLYLELSYWPMMIYDQGLLWPIVLWRSVMNIGLMMVLAVPMFAMSISRKADLPSGAAALWMPIHLAGLAGAGLMLFLVTIFWGIAGEFWPL